MDRFRIITVSRLEKYKGVECLIRAVPIIRKRYRGKLEVTIIGDGKDRERLEKIRDGLGLDCVRFLGKVAHGKLRQHHRNSDLFVHTSEIESFGIVIAEAMMAGLPVVATRVGGVPEIVKDGTGLLVPPRNINSLAEAILRMIKDGRLRKSLAAKGRAWAKNGLKWDMTTKKHENIMKDICKKDRMRVLLLSHEYPPVGGGGGMAAGMMGKRLAKNHNVEVVTGNIPGKGSDSMEDKAKVHRVFTDRKLTGNVKEFRRYVTEGYKKAEELHRERPFDIALAVFTLPAGQVANRLYRAYGLPYVINEQGAGVPWYNKKKIMPVKLFYFLLSWRIKKILRDAKKVTACSDFMADVINRHVKGMNAVGVHNGCDL